MDTRDLPNTAIVISDDAQTVLQAVPSTLEKAGFVVLAAAGSEIALKRAKKQSVDLAIIDTTASGINAGEVVRQLHESSPHARMLFLTGDAPASELHNTPSLGHVHRFLAKPFRRSQFLGNVLEIMDQDLVLSA